MRRTGTPFLFNRNGRYYFRRAVPAELRSRFARNEIKVALGTSDEAAARTVAREFATRFELLTSKVRNMTSISQSQIDNLVKSYFEMRAQDAAELAYLLPQDPMIDIQSEIDGTLSDIVRYQDQIGSREYDSATKYDARELLSEYGFPAIPLNSEEFDKLCHGVLRAKAEQRRVLAAMLQGQYEHVPPKDPLFGGIDTTILPQIDADLKQSGTLKSVSDGFCASKRKTGQWNQKTLADNQRVLTWFLEFVGSSASLTSVNKEHVRDFKDVLLNLPANFTKMKKYEGVPIREIAASNTGATTISNKTAAKYFDALRAFLSWCEAEDYIAKNPAASIKLKFKSDPQAARNPFSQSQLEKIFASPIYTGCSSVSRRSAPGDVVEKDAYYWIPLIALYSGMRLGEIVQLSIDDIDVSGETALFDIRLGEDSSKTLKTVHSARKVPVHPFLVGIGFLEFVEKRQKSGKLSRLFHEIKQGKDGYYSHNPSKWYGLYFRKIGAKTPKTAFHSFRHNFVDGLREAQVDESRIKALIGHSDSSVTSAYGSKYPVSILFNDLKKINFHLDLSHLQ